MSQLENSSYSDLLEEGKQGGKTKENVVAGEGFEPPT